MTYSYKIYELINSSDNHFHRLFEVDLVDKKTGREIGNSFDTEEQAKRHLGHVSSGAQYVILNVIQR